MKRKGWKNETQRHSMARKGVRTNKIKSCGKQKKIGIDFQSKFSEKDKDLIEYLTQNKIADMLRENMTSGQLIGEEPDFNGWFDVIIEKDDNDEKTRYNYIADLIEEGNTSGHYPTWYYRANIWRN